MPTFYVKTFFCAAFLILFLMSGAIFGQGKIQETEYEWEKIVLFVTKKSQIEQFYGKPTDKFEDSATFIYGTKFGKLTVYYRGEMDSNNSACRWSVAPDIVIGIRVGLFESIPVSKIKYTLGDFERKSNHIEEISYQNASKGIAVFSYFSDSREELISTIYYYPTSKDRKSHCVEP